MEGDILPGEIVEEKPPDTVEVSQRKRRYSIAILIIAVAIVVAVIVLVDKPDGSTDYWEYIRNTGYVGVLLMALIGSTSPIWPLPGSWAAFIAGGLGLNPIILGLVAGIGETIGELTAYMAGYGGQGAIAKWKRYKQIEGWTARHGAITIFLLSAVPNFFIKLVVMAAGALRYPWWKFFFLCWGGKTIKDFCFALAGAGLFGVIMSLLD
ncbi:MAG: VTT domain-containing protein [Dehalococcoidia bacterium]|nr:VTT domain-containing protein [Dehalococcoidia bacterium]